MTDTTMLYRPGSDPNPEAWHLPVETTIVADEDIEEALAEGWYRHPADFPTSPEAAPEPGPYDSLLDAPVKDIVPLLVEMTVEELAQLKAAEAAGKARSGLLGDIAKAIEVKAA